MNSQQIIETICSKYGFYHDDPIIKAIWDAACKKTQVDFAGELGQFVRQDVFFECEEDLIYIQSQFKATWQWMDEYDSEGIFIDLHESMYKEYSSYNEFKELQNKKGHSTRILLKSINHYKKIGQSVKCIIGTNLMNAIIITVKEKDAYPYYILFEDGHEGWVEKDDLI